MWHVLAKLPPAKDAPMGTTRAWNSVIGVAASALCFMASSCAPVTTTDDGSTAEEFFGVVGMFYSDCLPQAVKSPSLEHLSPCVTSSLLADLQQDEAKSFELLDSLRGEIKSTNEVTEGNSSTATVAVCVHQDTAKTTATFTVHHQESEALISAIHPISPGCDDFWKEVQH